MSNEAVALKKSFAVYNGSDVLNREAKMAAEPRKLSSCVGMRGSSPHLVQRDLQAVLDSLLQKAYIERWESVSHSFINLGQDLAAGNPPDKHTWMVTITGMCDPENVC